MPAVNYDYDYYNKRSDRLNKGVAKSARPNLASSKTSTVSKVSSNTTSKNLVRDSRATQKTSASRVTTKNTVRKTSASSNQTATKKVSTSTKSTNNANRKIHNHESIDVPIMVKKKLEIAKPQEMKLKKPKTNSKSKKKVEGAKRSIVCTVLAFAMLFVICTRYTKINEMTHEVNSLEKNLASAVALNQQLNAEVDSKTDLSYIEKYAKYQLGMQKPADSQIVRIAYEKQDKISTPVVISEEEESSFFDKLLNDLKNLID